MEAEVDKMAHLLDADMKVDRELEKLDDVKTLTEIIQHYRGKRGIRTSPPERRVNCRTFWSDLYETQRYRMRTICEQNEKGPGLVSLTP